MDLLERAPFLETLHGLLRDVGAGQGRLLLLGGEAGVGKTALVQRFGAEARQSARVMVGACDALSTPRALGPLLDLAPVLGGDLTRLLEAGTSRERLFAAFLGGLATGSRPTLAIIED